MFHDIALYKFNINTDIDIDETRSQAQLNVLLWQVTVDTLFFIICEFALFNTIKNSST